MSGCSARTPIHAAPGVSYRGATRHHWTTRLPAIVVDTPKTVSKSALLGVVQTEGTGQWEYL